ncbi:ABC transporter ATP-binding protein [Methanopyrus sp. KOL6]|uniref:ABC transporter ATP-binding protein n=1 Tax=Methanopyrus sp. KOL6 TaxID=1937004 RepID=UPI000B4B733F|nr:ABC transporter ATP-binding protein [Methanopyrus sp. KOL6]
MLRVEGVEFSYGDREVLRGVDLEVKPGKVRVLFGPNGSGKSTLLKIVAGILKPDKGRVIIGEEDVTDLPPEERHVGYVPQQPALFPHMTVKDNITYSLQNGRGDPDRLDELVELLGLKEYLDLKPDELSGGYQSRVSLARALFSDPKVMLLDEPLSDVDLAVKADLVPKFREVLKETGVPALYVTHDPWEAERIGDTFTVLVGGKAVDVGSVDEALEKLKRGVESVKA